jgi:ribulose-phosphate 3-epimerase
MSPEIIPAIIAENFRDLKKKVQLVSPYVNWIQLDVMDGKFVPNETWNEPEKLKNLLKQISFNINLEAHLMVKNPYMAFSRWIAGGCKRVIIHWESLGIDKKAELRKIIEKSKKIKCEIGLAFNPETPWQEAKDFILKKEISLVLLMSVSPGFSGQKLKKEVLTKIKSLRKFSRDVKIEVDGGVNKETGKLVVLAGANILIVGSAILEHKEGIKKAIQNLRSLC